MATNVSERDKKVLRELIEWLCKERDYVLQWRGKDGKGLVNDTVRPIDPWTRETVRRRICDPSLRKPTRQGDQLWQRT